MVDNTLTPANAPPELIAQLNAQAIQQNANALGSGMSAAQDAQYEVIKQQQAFSQPRNEYQAPSQAFLEIQNQYNQRHNQVVGSGVVSAPQNSGSNPFNPNSAAGIAWDIEKGGGSVGKSVSDKSVAQGYTPSSYQVKEQSTVPIRDLSSGMGGRNVPVTNVRSDYTDVGPKGELLGYRAQAMFTVPGVNTYMPLGEKEAQLRTDSKMIYSPGGAFNLEQLIPSTMPGFTRVFPMLTAGGGDYALQSGMVGGKAQTVIVYDQYGNPMWSKAQQPLVDDIRKNPDLYSNQGSDLYGGVMRLANKTMQDMFEPGGAVTMPGRYLNENKNYAMLPGLASPNTEKKDTGTQFLPSGASETLSTDSPFQMVDAITGKLSSVVPNWNPVKVNIIPYQEPEYKMVRPGPIERIFTPVQPLQTESTKYQPQFGGSLINNPAWNSTQEVGENAAYNANAAMLWQDRLSNAKFANQTWLEPQTWQLVKNPNYGNVAATVTSGAESVLGSVVGITPTSPAGVEIAMSEGSLPKPFMSGGGNIPTQNLGPVTLDEMLGNRAEFSGGLLGQWAFGEKAPEVIKGYVGSVVDFGTGIVGWTPFKDKMQITDESLVDFRTQKEAMQSKSPEVYNKFLTENYQKGNLIIQPGTGVFVENPEKTYAYGEYTKWGVGAGEVIRGKLGFTEAQLNQYQYQIEQKKGIENIPEKLVFGTGATLSTHPEKIATAYGAGAVMLFGGEILAGVSEATGATAAAGRFALAHPTVAAIGGGAIRYGVPATLAGITYYGASEGLTASPERTTVNLGRMIPEGAALVYGGASASVAMRGVDLGYFGYGTKEDLPRVVPKGFNSLQNTPEIPFKTTVIGDTAFGRAGIHLEPELGIPQQPAASSLSFVKQYGERTFSPQYTVKEIRQRQIGEPASQYAPLVDFSPPISIPKGTEAMDLSLALGRPSGKLPINVFEGLKIPAPESMPKFRNLEGGGRLIRVDEPSGRSYYTEDIAPIPMDLMPGVGKVGNLIRMENPRSALLPGTDRPSTFGMPKPEFVQPKGLESSFGGAPMSERMQATMINPTIQAGTRGGGSLSMDALIQEGAMRSRVSPATQAAEQLQILPSKTQFKQDYTLSPGSLENALKGITESEIRSTNKRLPTGMQMDYLRDALQQREPLILKSSSNQKGITGAVEYGPSRADWESYKQQYQQQSIQTPTRQQNPFVIQMQNIPQTVLSKQGNNQAQTSTQLQNPLQVNAPAQILNPIQVNVPQSVQQPAKTYIPAILQILNPIYARTPVTRSTYIPSFAPELRNVPERPYVPFTLPVLNPIPERGATPPQEPIPPEPIPPKPIIPGIPLLSFPTSGSGGGGSGGKKKRPTRFREVLPIITPIEEMRGFKGMGKSFFRAIGNQQILEVKPQQGERKYDVDTTGDPNQRQDTTANQVSNMTGMEFYRTATKQEKAKTGKPIMTYTPTQQEINMAKMTGMGSSNKAKKGKKPSWF